MAMIGMQQKQKTKKKTNEKVLESFIDRIKFNKLNSILSEKDKMTITEKAIMLVDDDTSEVTDVIVDVIIENENIKVQIKDKKGNVYETINIIMPVGGFHNANA